VTVTGDSLPRARQKPRRKRLR